MKYENSLCKETEKKKPYQIEIKIKNKLKKTTVTPVQTHSLYTMTASGPTAKTCKVAHRFLYRVLTLPPDNVDL